MTTIIIKLLTERDHEQNVADMTFEDITRVEEYNRILDQLQDDNLNYIVGVSLPDRYSNDKACVIACTKNEVDWSITVRSVFYF